MQTNQEQSQRRPRTFAMFVGIVTLFAVVAAGSVFVRAGWEKLDDPIWTGKQAGVALDGFMQGVSFKATKTERNPYPDALPIMRLFNEHIVAKHTVLFSRLVAWSELLAPLAVLALCCVRFRGSRALLLVAAGIAASMNLVYLHQGSSGSNPAMLLMWLTVIWIGATAPQAALTYAIDLRRTVDQTATEPRPAAGLWAFFAVMLGVLTVESVLITSAFETLVSIGIVAALAVVLHVINLRLGMRVSGSTAHRLSADGGLQTV